MQSGEAALAAVSIRHSNLPCQSSLNNVKVVLAIDHIAIHHVSRGAEKAALHDFGSVRRIDSVNGISVQVLQQRCRVETSQAGDVTERIHIGQVAIVPPVLLHHHARKLVDVVPQIHGRDQHLVRRFNRVAVVGWIQPLHRRISIFGPTLNLATEEVGEVVVASLIKRLTAVVVEQMPQIKRAVTHLTPGGLRNFHKPA